MPVLELVTTAILRPSSPIALYTHWHGLQETNALEVIH
jgi:hypothetical protein